MDDRALRLASNGVRLDLLLLTIVCPAQRPRNPECDRGVFGILEMIC